MDFVFLFLFLALIYFGVPIIYYLYLKFKSLDPWQLKIDEFFPFVTIIIPTYNEEKTIFFKLLNLCKVDYPKEKVEIIIVDDGSTDATLQKALTFSYQHPEFNIKIISDGKRRGKVGALNLALKHSRYDIIIVSDADTFWSPDILKKALPFLLDPSVGAINGRQILLSPRKTLLIRTEENYLDFTYGIIKLGESKIHSTILFHGLFSAYKKEFLTSFNSENDDSGTALDIVQKGVRTIYVPEAKCYELPPITWRGKLITKFRRACQLVRIYIRVLKLLLTRQLLLPKRIAIPEIFIFLINPLIFPALIFVLGLILVTNLKLLFYLTVTFIFLLVFIPKFKLFFIEAIQDNCILLSALFSCILGKRFLMWETLEDSRVLISEELLKSKNLI
ncbi:MAG: glycosyltransferase [Candidatus Aenigmatarchaeota archaeon]